MLVAVVVLVVHQAAMVVVAHPLRTERQTQVAVVVVITELAHLAMVALAL
jgi:hypothetical protein